MKEKNFEKAYTVSYKLLLIGTTTTTEKYN